MCIPTSLWKENLKKLGFKLHKAPLRPSLTLGVCGTADDIGEFGFEARVGGAVLAETFKAASAEWDYAL